MCHWWSCYYYLSTSFGYSDRQSCISRILRIDKEEFCLFRKIAFNECPHFANERISAALWTICRGRGKSFFYEGAFVCYRRRLHRFTKTSS